MSGGPPSTVSRKRPSQSCLTSWVESDGDEMSAVWMGVDVWAVWPAQAAKAALADRVAKTAALRPARSLRVMVGLPKAGPDSAGQCAAPVTSAALSRLAVAPTSTKLAHVTKP